MLPPPATLGTRCGGGRELQVFGGVTSGSVLEGRGKKLCRGVGRFVSVRRSGHPRIRFSRAQQGIKGYYLSPLSEMFESPLPAPTTCGLGNLPEHTCICLADAVCRCPLDYIHSLLPKWRLRLSRHVASGVVCVDPIDLYE